MIEIKGRKNPLELATQITRSDRDQRKRPTHFLREKPWGRGWTEMTARREMIFLFALNHQRTPQNLLGKGNQFLCQQRNPASNLSISSGKRTEPRENARVGGTAKHIFSKVSCFSLKSFHFRRLQKR